MTVRYTSIGMEITVDARTLYVALAGVVDGGGRAVVELLAPVPADEGTGMVAALYRDLPVDQVVVNPNGNGVSRSELGAAWVPLLEVTGVQLGEAVARFKIWTRSGRLKHRGHRDLTVAARAAEVKRSVSGVEQIVRRDAVVDPAALLSAQLAVFGLPADLSEGGGLAPDDVGVFSGPVSGSGPFGGDLASAAAWINAGRRPVPGPRLPEGDLSAVRDWPGIRRP
jgi:hypothetical protein